MAHQGHTYTAILKFDPIAKFEAVILRDDELLVARRFLLRAEAVAWLEAKRAGRQNTIALHHRQPRRGMPTVSPRKNRPLRADSVTRLFSGV